jgi:hypothetical protein
LWGGFTGGEIQSVWRRKDGGALTADTERSDFYLDAEEFIFIFRRDSIHLRHKIKHDMMTDTQRLIFREILDINWEFEQEKDWNKKIDLAKTLSAKKEELKTSMGEPEYNHFIDMGRQMFAPKR